MARLRRCCPLRRDRALSGAATRAALPVEDAVPDPSDRSAFVPHDLAAPLVGAANGALAGLTAAVKDMVDIAGERSGGGNPDWLAAQRPAAAHAPAVRKL